MSADLPRKLQRLLDGKCRYELCEAKLKDGSCYCEEHDARKRAQAVVRQAKLRLKLARERQCIDGCGTRVGRSDRGIRCADCLRANRERARRWRDSRKCDAQSTNVTPEPKVKLEVHKDGYTRVRTIGSGKRGQKPKSELDRDQKQLLADAEALIHEIRTRTFDDMRQIQASGIGRIEAKAAANMVALRIVEGIKAQVAFVNYLSPGLGVELAALLVETAKADAE